MEDVGLINPKKCAVAQRGGFADWPADVDGNVNIPTLEDGQHYKFLQSLRQEERIVLRCAAKNICVGCL